MGTITPELMSCQKRERLGGGENLWKAKKGRGETKMDALIEKRERAFWLRGVGNGGCRLRRLC